MRHQEVRIDDSSTRRVLQQNPLFAQLTTDEMGELIRAIQPVQLNEGDFLFKR